MFVSSGSLLCRIHPHPLTHSLSLPTEQVGHVFEVERYTVEVEKLLAAGGFANVYLARDVHSEKRYALKKVRPEQQCAENFRCSRSLDL